MRLLRRNFRDLCKVSMPSTSFPMRCCTRKGLRKLRYFSTKFPVEFDLWWKSAVQSIRNVTIYGDISTQQTRLMEVVLANSDSSKGKPASIHYPWMSYNLNFVHLPLEDEFAMNRAIRVIDGSVLLLCAVSSVSNTNVDIFMKKNGVARLIFVENMDKLGADPWKVITEVRTKLKLRSAALQVPIGLGSTFQGFVDIVEDNAYYFHKHGVFDVPENLKALVSGKRRELSHLLSKVDHSLMMDSSSNLQAAIRRATVARKFVPVLFGSALKYLSVQSLMDGICKYLPSPLEVNIAAIDHDEYEKRITLSGDPEGALVGLVFSTEDSVVENLSYIRLYEGMLRKGSSIVNVITEEKFEILVLFRVTSTGLKEVEHALAGDIVATSGLDFGAGDTLTDGTVRYTVPCTRSLSLRPIEIGSLHKLFSLSLRDRDRDSFRTGESLHASSIKTGLEMVMRHNLLSLYCNSQKYESVRDVLSFTEDFNRKLLNTLIHAFAEKRPKYSLACFRKLLHVGPPTDVTYRGLIRAYRHLKLSAVTRLKLLPDIIEQMEARGIQVERRHRVALIDLLLGGGLVDEAHQKVQEYQLHFDEKLVTSFLHAYTASEDNTLPKETDPVKIKKKVEANVEKCKKFVAEIEEKGILYSIHKSLEERLKAAGIKLGPNVSTSTKYRFVRERETEQELHDL